MGSMFMLNPIKNLILQKLLNMLFVISALIVAVTGPSCIATNITSPSAKDMDTYGIELTYVPMDHITEDLE